MYAHACFKAPQVPRWMQSLESAPSFVGLTSLVVTLAVLPATGFAQNPSDLRAKLDSLREEVVGLRAYRLEPLSLVGLGAAAGVPTSNAGSSLQIGIGLNFQNRARYGTDPDGAASFAVGYGDPGALLKITAGLSLRDVSNFERWSVGFRAARLLPGEFYLTVGIQNVVVVGISDAPTSVFGTLGRSLKLRKNASAPLSRMSLTMGLGGGMFQSEDRAANNDDSVNLFGAVATNFVNRTSLFASWTGQALNIGANLSTLATTRFTSVVTVALADVVGNAGDGVRILIGLGTGISPLIGLRQ